MGQSTHSEAMNSVCDHCQSTMDDPLEGMRGEYCSSTCFYAEELGEVHPDHNRVMCPNCAPP